MELIEYFQSYENYFWEWVTDEDISDDSGYYKNNLLSVPNVGAITYRPYLIGVLRELQPQGFPPLGSLLLVLYATQSSYVNLDGIFYYIRNLKIQEPTEKNINILSACKFLENLNSVGYSYKRGQNKVNLIQTIFKNSHNLISGTTAAVILSTFEKNPEKIELASVQLQLTDSVVSRDIRTLSLLHEKFPTAESIIHAIQGIGDKLQLEDEVVEEETTVETGKDFIQELIDDPKTFQVGSLIKRIWSGLKIPMHHLSPGDQPIGGISDMTNKGELHRMLLSEFANEDEVFMSRVANNETLFIQREIPPEENRFERIILIDTSLRNWGTPKVLAFASALAVIKHPKANSECKVFALGETKIPISLNRTEEVIENLNQVSPVLEVSAALHHFFQDKHQGKDLEVFFITNQENLANHNLQKIIHENRDRLKFLVTTSSDGEMNFYKHHKGARKHLQKITLPLKELWANSPKRKQNSQNTNGNKTDLPVNYPILFPNPVNKIATFLYEGEFFILSSKKQLLRTYLSDNYYQKQNYDYYKIHRGCEVLIENISVKPKGQFALAKNKRKDFILCQYQQDKKLISKLNLNTKEYSELNLTGKNIPLNFKLVYFNKSFHLYHEDHGWAFEINIDGNLSLESIKYDSLIDKSQMKTENQMRRLTHSSIKILSNFNNIAVNSKNNLIISNNELNIVDKTSLTLYKNKHQIKIFATQNKNKFTFSEGSEVITDSRGMITFKSSNRDIPDFYIPSTEYGFLALATNTKFAGSEYFLPKKSLLKVVELGEMYSEYVEAFINEICDYET